LSYLTRWRSERARAAFTSVRDFCERVRLEGPDALNLIRAGAFGSLGSSRTEQFWRFMHCSRDVNAGADWLIRNAREDDIRATFREEPSLLQSCNHRAGHIRLNTELVKKPKDLLEYVIVHEMAHLLEPTHSERFMAILDKHYSSWREARAELNELPLSAEAWRE